MTSFGLVGTGGCIPSDNVDNEDLGERFGVTEEWILERARVHRRRRGPDAGKMAGVAAIAALASANLQPSDVDLGVVATTTPPSEVPSCASIVQHQLGITGACFDVKAACAGFVYALAVASQMLPTVGTTALIVGTDQLSRILDFDDLSTVLLMAAGPEPSSSEWGVGKAAACCPTISAGMECLHDCLFAPRGHREMQGRSVFKTAVVEGERSVRQSMSRDDLTVDDVDWLVLHQANARITAALAQRLDLAQDRVLDTIGYIGNTSAASSPVAMGPARADGRLTAQQAILLAGFGAGMAWGGLDDISER